MASKLQRFSAAQVCEIITRVNGKVDCIFPGSDDELDALQLCGADEDQAGTDDGRHRCLGQSGENRSVSVTRYSSELVAYCNETEG